MARASACLLASSAKPTAEAARARRRTGGGTSAMPAWAWPGSQPCSSPMQAHVKTGPSASPED
eukprot:4435568-Lingulodinium_polyedra.AAC.1